MKAITRRRFLSQSAAGLAAAAATGVIRSRSVVGAAQRANDAVVLALVGAGGRGTALAEGFSQLPNVSFKYVCDVETPRGEGMAKKLSKAGVAETQIVGDSAPRPGTSTTNWRARSTANRWTGTAPTFCAAM